MLKQHYSYKRTFETLTEADKKMKGASRLLIEAHKAFEYKKDMAVIERALNALSRAMDHVNKIGYDVRSEQMKKK